MAKYINPFTDSAFKRLFGQEEHKSLLIAFLNRLFEGEFIVKDVKFLDKERFPGHDNGKNFIYDIYCTIDDGKHIIVEMQNRQQAHFVQRSLLYAARAIDRQSKIGEEWSYEDLKAVYIISFLNFTLDEFPSRLLVDGKIIDAKSGKEINPFLRLLYIQLPQMKKNSMSTRAILNDGSIF